ncbi:metabotropic glycine receptor-like [Gordionus sp. m RMFG-2023]|uniref:metabotropic glycine receptor-like n=1 Tax=Gordionus sp. m RMFG-2023 TaxID=3053472 RepID=UPI0031FDB3B3
MSISHTPWADNNNNRKNKTVIKIIIITHHSRTLLLVEKLFTGTDPIETSTLKHLYESHYLIILISLPALSSHLPTSLQSTRRHLRSKRSPMIIISSILTSKLSPYNNRNYQYSSSLLTVNFLNFLLWHLLTLVNVSVYEQYKFITDIPDISGDSRNSTIVSSHDKEDDYAIEEYFLYDELDKHEDYLTDIFSKIPLNVPHILKIPKVVVNQDPSRVKDGSNNTEFLASLLAYNTYKRKRYKKVVFPNFYKMPQGKMGNSTLYSFNSSTPISYSHLYTKKPISYSKQFIPPRSTAVYDNHNRVRNVGRRQHLPAKSKATKTIRSHPAAKLTVKKALNDKDETVVNISNENIKPSSGLITKIPKSKIIPLDAVKNSTTFPPTGNNLSTNTNNNNLSAVTTHKNITTIFKKKTDPNYVGGRNKSSNVASMTAHRENQSGRSEVDKVTEFLKIVEEYENDAQHCKAGTTVNLGDGVIDQYGLKRYYSQALIAVNRANLLTRLWRYAPKEVLDSEFLLYSLVRSMVESDVNIFAAGNCYDKYEYKDYYLFCPFSHYLPDGKRILVKDLSVQYKYMGNESEWFHSSKMWAKNLSRFQKLKGVYNMRYNGSADAPEEREEILAVTYKDGHWSKPYFDCGGGNIWMMTYTIPFFGFKNGSFYFKGTSGIDIDLRKVDIDQCPTSGNDTTVNVFADSDKCQNRSTVCIPVEGQGFRRGSYRCVCKKGFYFPFKESPEKYFLGTDMEDEFDKYIKNGPNKYQEMICLPCPKDCEECVDFRPCSVTTNKILRIIILCLQCMIMCVVPALAWFTWAYRDIKIVKASSPVLLYIFLAGALFLYLPVIVTFPDPSTVTCTMKLWFREIGFSIAYGAILFKTWRIARVFRVRSAAKIKITDMDLIKRMGIIVATFLVLVIARTSVSPANVTTIYNKEHLKAYLCVTDWWDYSIALTELALLLWGIKLSFDVRKAPSEFNESKFISMAIYNEFLLSLFLNISLFFLQTYGDPDLLYIILFIHCQLTTTSLLGLIFGNKIYSIYKGLGNKAGGTIDQAIKNKFFKGKVGGTENKSQAASLLSQSGDTSYANIKDQDTAAELKRLYALVEAMKIQNMKLGNRHIPGYNNILKAKILKSKSTSHFKKSFSTKRKNLIRKFSNDLLDSITDSLSSPQHPASSSNKNRRAMQKTSKYWKERIDTASSVIDKFRDSNKKKRVRALGGKNVLTSSRDSRLNGQSSPSRSRLGSSSMIIHSGSSIFQQPLKEETERDHGGEAEDKGGGIKMKNGLASTDNPSYRKRRQGWF